MSEGNRLAWPSFVLVVRLWDSLASATGVWSGVS